MESSADEKGAAWATNAAPLGAGASVFLAACCMGAPAALGFLATDIVLLPLLAVALWVALWGLRRGVAIHGDPRPHRTGVAGAAAILLGIWAGGWLVAIGAIVLVGATVWNVVARRTCGR